MQELKITDTFRRIMLRRICVNLDLDQVCSKEGYQHHSSYLDLTTSAGKGCELCHFICHGDPSMPRGMDLELMDNEISCHTRGCRGTSFSPIDFLHFKQGHPAGLSVFVFVFTTPGMNLLANPYSLVDSFHCTRRSSYNSSRRSPYSPFLCLRNLL